MWNNRSILTILILTFLSLFFINDYTFAHSKIKPEEYITKQELEILLKNTPSNLSKEDLTDMLLKNNELLLESRKDKIEILEGNIASILSLIGIVLAVLALLITGFGFWLRHNFTKKYEEVLVLKDTVEDKMKHASALEKSLNSAQDDLNANNKSLINLLNDYKSGIKTIEELRKYIEKYQEYTDTLLINNKTISLFQSDKGNINVMFSEIERLLKKDFSVQEAIQDGIEKMGIKKAENPLREQLENKYEYYKKILEEEENKLWYMYKKDIDYMKDFFTSDEEYANEIPDIYKEWKNAYNKIDDIYKQLKGIERFLK
jgi:hypothetical protein